MASRDEAQDFVGCDLCQQPVSFFCRRCGVNLCDPCALRHLRVKSKTGHDIVDYTSKEDDDTCHRDYHSHKFFVLLGCISLVVLFLHLRNNCSAMYQLFTDEVTPREEECQKQIEEAIKKLHQEVDDMQKGHEAVLQKQKKEFKEMIEKVGDMQKGQNDALQKQKKEFEEMIKKVGDMQKGQNDALQKQKKEFKEMIEKVVDIQKGQNDALHTHKKEFEEMIEKVDDIQKGQNDAKVDDIQKRQNDVLQKHKKEFEEMIEKVDDIQKGQNDAPQKHKKDFKENIEKVNEINERTIKIQKTKNVKEMQTFNTCIRKRKIMTEVLQYSIPKLYKLKIDELLENELTENEFSCRRILDIPTVISVIDTGFPANEKNKNRLYDMAVTVDNKVWMGGHSKELKLFDLKGHLHHTVRITVKGLYFCMYNKQVVYSDQPNKAVRMISDTDTVVTMFTTGDWKPYGVTSTASGDLLVCLRKDDQSKVVRYSSTGTVLQEIQYDPQGKPLYKLAIYITENVNGDIIVTDWKKKTVIAVDRFGIFRYSYSGKNSDFRALSVATDSVGHVIVTGGVGKKISMLDRDGRFLRYIIPEGGIKDPRAMCILGDGEMMVGECLTGIAKRIKYLED